MPTFKTFSFEDYTFDPATKTASFSYSFDRTVFFKETIIFDFPFTDYDKKALDRALHGLWVMAGISYFKAACPKEIVFQKNPLTQKQAQFFNHVWTQGLGEFCYQNNLSPKGIVSFPFEKHKSPSFGPSADNFYNGSLIPLGGGKDSLTTVELLKKEILSDQLTKPHRVQKDNNLTHTITVGHKTQMQPQSDIIGLPHLCVERKICPNLLKLNKEGALNGHVPISAFWAFLFVVTAVLTKKKYIVLSNESSANEPNIMIDGVPINHQYSKSLDFEKHFQSYVKEFISKDIVYFSLLRPFCELKIAELFAQHCFSKYQHLFSSCNRNFVQTNTSPFTWCGDCPKCAFVFLILTPFITKNTLIETFGENLLAKPELKNTFQELLGLKGQKPFECVGTTDECRKAALMAMPSWPELGVFEIPSVCFDKDQMSEHLIPEAFIPLLP